MKNIISVLIILSGLFVCAAEDLSTAAERSGWVKTGRAAETQTLRALFAKKFPKRVECKSYGTTPEGRTLWYMVVSDSVRSKASVPTVWAQAGIHAGEIDGKDAVFYLLKTVLEKSVSADPFKGLRFVFVPIVNLDGHERFGKWNRPNQVGPEEMGWRVTAQNYNMNRDFAKVDSDEMRALNTLWNKYDPIVSLDLHVTDGAHFQPEMGIIVTPTTHHGDSALHRAGKDLENQLMIKMKERSHSVLPFYPSFEKDDQPMSGFSRSVSPPRFANGYWYVRNRIGILIESHSWKDYATRVKGHHDVVVSALEAVQKNGAAWVKVAKDMDAMNLAGSKIDVSFKRTDKFSTIDFGGYKFTIEKSKVSGDKVIRYQTDKPETWKVPLYEELIPSVTVTAASKGYFIPASEMNGIRKQLDVHNIKYEVWKKPLPEKVNVFRASKALVSANSFEGHQTVSIEGQWAEEKIEWPAKLFFVPIQQPGARLVVHLLEPLAPDSFAYWGLFNRFFEVKEYMEDYVAEDVAIQMLAGDQQIEKEFKEKLKDDTFAKDPRKRLQFFHQKHSSWDDHYNRYPVFKL